MSETPDLSEHLGSEHESEASNVINGEQNGYEPPRKRRKRPRSETPPVDFQTILNTMASNAYKPPRFVVHHEVVCHREVTDGHNHSSHPTKATYIDVPRLCARDSRASPLRGKEQVYDLNTYQHQNEDVCMIVCKRYDCQEYHDTHHRLFTKYPVPTWVKSMGPYDTRPWFYFLMEDGPEATSQSEYIYLCSDVLKAGLTTLSKIMPRADLDGSLAERLESPYDYFYHHHTTVRELSESLLPQDQQPITVLLDYILASQEHNFQEADTIFDKGYVTQAHFGKLFKVSDIVVRREAGGPRAYQIESLDLDEDSLSIQCWTWEFDGQFHKSKHEISIDFPLDQDQVHITSLAVWPLRLDQPELLDNLIQRGEMFWSLRSRKLVHYDAPISDTFELRTSNPKYMIDMSAYRSMHSEQLAAPDPDRENLASSAMNEIDPPEAPFVVLLPANIKGFGFHDKKWRTLQVSSMKEVNWNKQAFERLVLKHNKKELIEALVTVHLENSAMSDVVEGKGAGLILLLHGPPGTGKTMTAESVAELAKKPLYRITCGDMGTDPESVEKYLEAALFIGTMWECVVLLDEADVFLEERTQTDLVRNALVSVFLRVLEYYEGILILTSNRVGSFDEAFKSRMQLAIQYPILGFHERKSIWTNFLETLEESGVDMKSSELRREIDKLAAHEFNGRQIRNLIKTARQLAAHRNKETLQAKHLEHVIEVANEFESYIVKTKGVTDEQRASKLRMRAQ